jgi:HD-GYP domain-containing protein (c-di-GMP phosphodiesterase class II)
MRIADPEECSELETLLEFLSRTRPDVAEHNRRVGQLSWRFALELGFDEERANQLEFAGSVHDIGKLGVPEAVLAKPGPLTEIEWVQVRLHAQIGADLLRNQGLYEIADWVVAHHERPDGTGYPYGLAADEIPLEARILAVIDAYNAMTSDRPYHSALTRSQAIAELRGGAGTQFDLEIAEAFLAAIQAMPRAIQAMPGIG